ncbi:hypothetical protein WN48_01998 [Eufriesea mexicana]|nr:hypothetical protein WN48_01998 [Eufriesea mexicana]
MPNFLHDFHRDSCTTMVKDPAKIEFDTSVLFSQTQIYVTRNCASESFYGDKEPRVWNKLPENLSLEVAPFSPSRSGMFRANPRYTSWQLEEQISDIASLHAEADRKARVGENAAWPWLVSSIDTQLTLEACGSDIYNGFGWRRGYWYYVSWVQGMAMISVIYWCCVNGLGLLTVGIEVRVTNEVPASSTEENVMKDAAPPWTTMSVPNSRTTPPTPTNHHPQYLSPHVFQGRNSLCCTNDYTLRRRRPMTLRIGPRLSLPNKSTSAPTTTTDGDWPVLRLDEKKDRFWMVLMVVRATNTEQQILVTGMSKRVLKTGLEEGSILDGPIGDLVCIVRFSRGDRPVPQKETLSADLVGLS